VASSTNRSLDSMTRQSPGTLLPADRTTMSSGTICSSGTSTEAPPRSTAALVCTVTSSLATALAAPCSCQNPNSPLTRTMATIIPPSAWSPR
jgi:hypothetical protein